MMLLPSLIELRRFRYDKIARNFLGSLCLSTAAVYWIH
jgi:hypothetical protein